ncbi:SdpI family protein [Maribacter sp. 2308TA10-17]|uniref:SdpI family protein n=1 Tax=Maribacter sp. 2308TA10-17 TaxID=3386276 RepID=UPI0039BC4EE9
MEALFAAFSIPAIFLIAAFLWKKFPPKTISHFYGYRTRRTMSNQDIWDYANQIGPKMFLTLGLVLLIITVLGYLIFSQKVILIVIFAMLIGIGVGMFWCETQLNKYFDKNGNRRTKH